MFKKISLSHFSCQSSFKTQHEKRKIRLPNSRTTNDYLEKVKNTILIKGYELEKHFLSFSLEQSFRGYTQFSKTILL